MMIKKNYEIKLSVVFSIPIKASISPTKTITIVMIIMYIGDNYTHTHT